MLVGVTVSRSTHVWRRTSCRGGVHDDDGNNHIDDNGENDGENDNDNNGHIVIVVPVLVAADQGWRQLSRIAECAESNVEFT